MFKKFLLILTVLMISACAPSTGVTAPGLVDGMAFNNPIQSDTYIHTSTASANSLTFGNFSQV